MIERIHLEIVRAVDRYGSVTRAAESLCLTQPALSHSIARLERVAGTRLWRRQGRTVRLTEAGRYLLQSADRIVPELEEIDRRLAEFAAGSRGLLRIGMECHPCYDWLLGVLPAFLDAQPKIDVDVTQRFQFTGLDALLNHEIDLVVTPDPVNIPGVRYEPVLDYELRLVVAAGSPLAARAWAGSASTAARPAAEAAGRKADGAAVRAADLADQTLLTYPVPRDRLDVFTRLLIPAGVVPAETREVETTELMLAMVAAGRAVTTLPSWMTARLDDRFVHLRLGEGIHKQLMAGCRSDTDQPAVQAFLALCRSHVSS